MVAGPATGSCITSVAFGIDASNGLAVPKDRAALDELYRRQGMSFRDRPISTPRNSSSAARMDGTRRYGRVEPRDGGAAEFYRSSAQRLAIFSTGSARAIRGAVQGWRR